MAAAEGSENLNLSEYRSWIADLQRRYRACQIKAAVSVNSALLEFYWQLGRDIIRRENGTRWSMKRLAQLSVDLKRELTEAKCFSPQNLYYIRGFYQLYALNGATSETCKNEGEREISCIQQLVEKLVRIPWGHHVLLMNKCGRDRRKALFYVQETLANNWSRDVLLNEILSDRYARQGMALTNYPMVLPQPDGDLAQQLTKDPYVFAVQGLSDRYREHELKLAMTKNVERLLQEMGKGFAFVGREYPIEIEGEEKIVDLLFYFIPLHRYFVVEVKTGEFKPEHLGQLQGYVAACDLTLNRPGDNPAMGLLICRGKNETLARYMLGKTDMPLGVSDYERLIVGRRTRRTKKAYPTVPCVPSVIRPPRRVFGISVTWTRIMSRHGARAGYHRRQLPDALQDAQPRQRKSLKVGKDGFGPRMNTFSAATTCFANFCARGSAIGKEMV